MLLPWIEVLGNSKSRQLVNTLLRYAAQWCRIF